MRETEWVTVHEIQFEKKNGKFTGWYRHRSSWRPNGVWPEYRRVGDIVQVR